MTLPTLVYPVIFSEFDDDGHYFTVTSPNLPGMVTEGATRAAAATEAIDAIATMLDGEPYPDPQDPTGWALQTNDSVVYIAVDMAAWFREKARWQRTATVRRTVIVPAYLNELAQAEHLDVSRIVTEALTRELQTD